VDQDARQTELCEHTLTALVALLGEPSLIFMDDQGPGAPASHHCAWPCGCEASNVHGICLEEGWELEGCRVHAAAEPEDSERPFIRPA
jgi:hypothetical protein